MASLRCTVPQPPYTSPVGWDRPSDRVRELMRCAAQIAVDAGPQFFRRMRDEMLSSDYLRVIADDPVAVSAIDRANQAVLSQWAAANLDRPGEPVSASLDPEALIIARYLVRRGLDEAMVVEKYRLAQNVGLKSWMRIVFRLTDDPEELREFFEVSYRSITSYLSAMIAGIHQQMQIERAELAHGAHAERREAVALILDGAPIAVRQAEMKLGYPLEQSHTAAVIWSEGSHADLSDLDRAAELLTQSSDGRRSLSVLASADTRWVWLPGADGVDVGTFSASMRQVPDVRVTLGSTAAGIDGFRRSHLDAITAQRVTTRLGSARRITRFVDIQLVALITADSEQSDRFITETLGDFASADAELQRTVLTFVYEQCNASRAAARLFLHRNTLLRRIAHANALLPRPLEEAGVHVAVALEALGWRSADPRL